MKGKRHMKVVLAKNDKLLNYMLPNKVTGNIWLSEIDENGKKYH